MRKQNYFITRIRALLINGFTVDELCSFCFDDPKFRSIYDNYCSAGTEKIKLVHHLIYYAERKKLMDDVLVWAKETNPAAYELYGPYYRTSWVVSFTKILLTLVFFLSLSWKALDGDHLCPSNTWFNVLVVNAATFLSANMQSPELVNFMWLPLSIQSSVLILFLFSKSVSIFWDFLLLIFLAATILNCFTVLYPALLNCVN